MKNYKVNVFNGMFFHVVADSWGKEIGPGYVAHVFMLGEQKQRVLVISSEFVESVVEAT